MNAQKILRLVGVSVTGAEVTLHCYDEHEALGVPYPYQLHFRSLDAPTWGKRIGEEILVTVTARSESQ